MQQSIGLGARGLQRQDKEIKRRRKSYRLCPHKGLAPRPNFSTHARQRPEQVVCEHVDATMVGLEVVDLLSEDERPQVLAQKLDDVERVIEARAVAGKAVGSDYN